MASGLPDITGDLRLLLDNEIFYDPWLAAILERDIDPAADVALHEGVARLAHEFWSDRARADALGILPIGDQFLFHGLRETALSTHYLQSINEGLGRHLDMNGVEVLIARLRSFAITHGLGPILRSYLGVIGYENTLVLRYYGGVSEADFVSGRKHRPWLEAPLWDELTLLAGAGIVSIELRNGRRYCILTEFGEDRFHLLRTQLQDAGYFRRRIQALYIAHFDETSESYDHLFDNIIPDLMATRGEFLRFCELEHGMHVLEVGCGTGIFTLECDLAGAVAPGTVLATDPSAEMMAVAFRKARDLGVRNVEFALGRAESPPTDGHSFDAFVGSLALHFTDPDQTLRAAHDVLRPGGTVAMFWGLAWQFQTHPMIVWWLDPLIRLVSNPKDSGFSASRFITLERARELLSERGFVDIEVREVRLRYDFWHVEELVRVILSLSLFQREFEQLPWQARSDLIHDLVERGREAVLQGREQLTIDVPMGMLRARKPTDAAVAPRKVLQMAHSLARRRPPLR